MTSPVVDAVMDATDVPGSGTGALRFEEYVAACRPVMLRAAYRLTRDPHRAEDLVQSALARVYPSWPRLRDPRAADAYLRRAMFNQNASWWRESRRHPGDLWLDLVPERAAPATPASSPGVGPAPDERAALWDLVQTLPPRQRATVALRFYEDLSEAETARVLGCSVGTVKSNTSRALATLRQRTSSAQDDAGPGSATRGGPSRSRHRPAPACTPR